MVLPWVEARSTMKASAAADSACPQFCVQPGRLGLFLPAPGLGSQHGACGGQVGAGAQHHRARTGLPGRSGKDEPPGRSAQAGGGAAVGRIVTEPQRLVLAVGQGFRDASLHGKAEPEPAAAHLAGRSSQSGGGWSCGPPLGMNRSQGVAVRVQGAWLWFSMVYCTATVFCP